MATPKVNRSTCAHYFWSGQDEWKHMFIFILLLLPSYLSYGSNGESCTEHVFNWMKQNILNDSTFSTWWSWSSYCSCPLYVFVSQTVQKPYISFGALFLEKEKKEKKRPNHLIITLGFYVDAESLAIKKGEKHLSSVVRVKRLMSTMVTDERLVFRVICTHSVHSATRIIEIVNLQLLYILFIKIHNIIINDFQIATTHTKVKNQKKNEKENEQGNKTEKKIYIL